MKYLYTMNNVEALKENIKHEKNVVKELSALLSYLDTVRNLERIGYRINNEEKKLLQYTADSLISQLRILNNSLPELINKMSFFKELPSKEPEKKVGVRKVGGKLVSFKYTHPSLEKREALVTIRKAEKLKFLNELRVTDNSLRKIRKKHEYLLLRNKLNEFKKPSKYAKFSNKFFSRFSDKLINKGRFTKLSRELRKANLPFLSRTYISMAFFTSWIAFFASVVLLILLLFFNLSIELPFLLPTDEFIGLRLLKYFWIIFVIPVLTFFAFIFYPSAEKRAVAGKINQELPFVVIHMSAIAGSKVEPTNIFKIIVTGEEYPNTKKEFKKLLNQINLYGYDIVSALRSCASLTSSTKLAELFSGLSTTITSGGNLSEFLDKRAETLVFDYKTEREKATRVAETFMDIYISVVIAAPMIMTLLLVMMSVTPALSFGLTLQAANILMLLGIALINVLFIMFLHLKQPKL